MVGGQWGGLSKWQTCPTFSLSHLPIIVPVPIPISVHLNVCGWWWQRGFSRCLAAIKLDFISLHFQIIMISSELWWTHLDSILCPMEPTSRPSADTIGGIHYWCIWHTVYHKHCKKLCHDLFSGHNYCHDLRFRLSEMWAFSQTATCQSTCQSKACFVFVFRYHRIFLCVCLCGWTFLYFAKGSIWLVRFCQFKILKRIMLHSLKYKLFVIFTNNAAFEAKTVFVTLCKISIKILYSSCWQKN